MGKYCYRVEDLYTMITRLHNKGGECCMYVYMGKLLCGCALVLLCMFRQYYIIVKNLL